MLLRLVCFMMVFVSLFGSVRAREFSQAERNYMDRYLQEHQLNRFGDPPGTMYSGGTPLFDEATGACLDRHEYVIRRHPRILDGFIGILRTDSVRVAAALDEVMRGGTDLGQTSASLLETAEKFEGARERLIGDVRTAIERKDYEAIDRILNALDGMDRGRLVYFSSALRDMRRMLQGPTVDELRVTEQVKRLLSRVTALERRIAR